MKVDRKWATLGWLTVFQIIRRCRKNAFEIAQIYGATTYLKGVHILRDFFLYQIGILAFVMLAVFGVILMEAAAVFYIPVGTSTRIILVFAVGAINALIGILFLYYAASSKEWLRRASKHNAWVKSSIEEEENL